MMTKIPLEGDETEQRSSGDSKSRTKRRCGKYEEMEDILLTSLESFGVSIPYGVTSIQSITPDSLFAICSQSLSIVDRSSSSSFPESLPESTADRFKICKDMAEVVKERGYLGDISFHQFLYPSEDDLYKLVRFLIEKLSESGTGVTKVEDGNVEGTSEYLRPKVELLNLSETDHDERIGRGFQEDVYLKEEMIEDPLGVSRVKVSEKAESSSTAKTGCEVEVGDPQTKEILSDTAVLKDFDLSHSEYNVKFLETETDIASDDQHSNNLSMDQLMLQIDAKRSKLVELESHWNSIVNPLELKKKNLLNSLCATNPSVLDKYQNLKEMEAQIHSVESEITQRREECFKLSADVEKMPTVAPRRSYVQRINEITKNSRKLDADIERILKETRELQMESNSTQESLHRTYAITSETILRDGKTTPVGQQAYKILSRIHENFHQISEKILATDRLKREAAENEKKLTSMASQKSLDIDKLQADLEAIRKDNEALQKHRPQSSI